MPGIVGIIGPRTQDENTALLTRMLQPMMHEAFYSSGTYVNPSAGVFVGSVQLDSRHAAALVWNERQDIGCWLAGEEDPAALLASYENIGTRALEHLNGWFSGVLVDLRNRKTILFNDRYGLGRVYVHQAGERLFFSSEAKSLQASRPATRRLDPRGVAEWFTCGCALQNRTLFAGIELLPPGSCWTYSPAGLAKDVYFKPEQWESLPILEQAEYEERLQETFPRVLQRYTAGPVGMSLTGGLDGRMIMAWSRGELPCYTFNGPIRDCADVQLARQIAKLCRQSHQTIPVENEFFAQFPKLAMDTVSISDGAMDVSGAVELYVNRLARQIAPVRLTGNYGSEILRRNVAFRPRPLPAEFFSADLVEHGRQAGQTYAEEARGHRLSFIAFKQVPWHHYSRLAVEQSQLTMRSPFLDNELVALAFQASPATAAVLEPSLRLIAAGNPALAALPTDRGVTYPASNGLRRAFHDGVAKAEYAWDYGMPAWAARIAGNSQIERLFLGRQKFCHFRSWYRDQLAEHVRDVLLDSRARLSPYVNWGKLEPLIADHLAGRRNLTLAIHQLLSFELINRLARN